MNIQNALVSIIIPTYNRAHLIGETLDSVLAQTYTNWECIVVDDGSTDGTEALLQKYVEHDSRFQYHHRPKDRPKGANACRNYGFEISKGEYIQWFDSDDLMLPFFLNDCLKLFRNNIKLQLALTDYNIFDHSAKQIFHRQRNEINILGLDYFTKKVNFGLPHSVWTRTVVANFKFDEHLDRAQELDFFFQIFSKKNIQWSKIANVAVLIRRHNQSITSAYNKNCFLSLKSELKVRIKILEYLYNNHFSKEKISAALDIYLKCFYKYSLSQSIGKSYVELKNLEKTIRFKPVFIEWKIKLLFLLFIVKVLKRNHRLKLHFKKVNKEFYAR
ncbi:MAG: hypothetical protein CL526_00895 [Aequorivita sp.]|nr:hypothetical protein [Aequorivita sp.]|tara:strand:+ start:11413 stop:12402 length:990 start_codon:yes stop_codon:yes gene_type:complete